MGNVYIERRHDGRLWWIRQLAGRSDGDEAAWVREERLRDRRALGDVPSSADMERLLAIYVATGEGQGAYLAARMAEEQGMKEMYRTYYPMDRPPRRTRYSYFDDDDDDSDGYGYGFGPTRPLRPSGGPSGGPSEGYIPTPEGRYQSEDPRSHVVWTPLLVVEGDRRRFVHAEEYDPSRRENYQPYYPDAAVFHTRPRPVHPRRPVHGAVDTHGAEPVAETEHDIEVIIQRPDDTQYRPPPPPPPAAHPELHQARPPAPRPVFYDRPQGLYPGGQDAIPPRPEGQYEVEVSEDEPEYASLPSEEDDFRLQSRQSHESRPVRSKSSRSRQSRRTRTSARIVEVRPREGSNPEVEEGGGHSASVHLRGGGARPRGSAPPTKMASIGAGVLPKGYSTDAKEIVLFFFYTSRGKILSSRKGERYTTFQELVKNRDTIGVVNEEQLSDQWLVNKLHQHYYLINRRQQSAFWDLVLLRTIGFATFLRFERTVDGDRDPNGFTVTAKVPAISAQGEAVSQFQYLLKYPLKSAKMMLSSLDRLAGMTATNMDRHCFYVVEIKEAVDTGKIYTLLILLIFISAGGGTAYAVVRSDPSTGLSIASYVLTALSLMLALVAAGQWLGLSKPDSFSFAYSLEKNQVLGAANVGRILGGSSRRRPRGF